MPGFSGLRLRARIFGKIGAVFEKTGGARSGKSQNSIDFFIRK
jgi:hypothetical protein